MTDYRIVPVEPTREMWAAAGDAVVRLQHQRIGHHDKISEAVWTAMLSAAPAVDLREKAGLAAFCGWHGDNAVAPTWSKLTPAKREAFCRAADAILALFGEGE